MRPFEPRALLTLVVCLSLTFLLNFTLLVASESDAALRGAPVRLAVRVRVGLLCRREAREPQLVRGDVRVQRIRGRARDSRVARED